MQTAVVLLLSGQSTHGVPLYPKHEKIIKRRKEQHEELAEIVTKVFDLRPAAIIDRLDLSMPIYKKTSAYGHFNSPDFPWEKTDAVPELVKVAK